MNSRNHQRYNCNIGCKAENTLEVIRGKWKGVIITLLSDRTYRFSELQQCMPGVTQRMLTRQLRELEEAGIVEREVISYKPIAVSYSLTELGKTLKPVMECLKDWGNNYGHLLYPCGVEMNDSGR
ncbi:MAG: helix-turn-helix domain-containing protein [Reinekea sp.]